MKRMKTIILAAMLVSSGAAFASGNLTLSLIPENKNLKVNISNAVESKYEIEITNSNGDLLYYKMTKDPSASFTSTYNFSTLRDGEYTYKVSLGDESATAYLNVKRGQVTVLEQRKDLKPFFALKDKQLNVSFLNFEREKLLLVVYDNKTNEILYRKGFDRDFAISHAISFAELKKGSYDAILVTQSENYSYEVNVE